MIQRQRDEEKKWDHHLAWERSGGLKKMTLSFDLCTPERANLWFMRPVYTPPGTVCMCIFSEWVNSDLFYFNTGDRCDKLGAIIHLISDYGCRFIMSNWECYKWFIFLPPKIYLSIPLLILTQRRNRLSSTVYNIAVDSDLHIWVEELAPDTINPSTSVFSKGLKSDFVDCELWKDPMNVLSNPYLCLLGFFKREWLSLRGFVLLANMLRYGRQSAHF